MMNFRNYRGALDYERGLQLAILTVMAVIHYLGAAPLGPLLSWSAAGATYFCVLMFWLTRREPDPVVRWIWFALAVPLFLANATNTAAFIMGHVFYLQEMADVFIIIYVGSIGPAAILAADRLLLKRNAPRRVE